MGLDQRIIWFKEKLIREDKPNVVFVFYLDLKESIFEDQIGMLRVMYSIINVQEITLVRVGACK